MENNLLGPFILAVIILVYAGIILFWIFMLIDAIKRNFGKGKDIEKLIWVLVILLLNVLGAVLYYFMIKRKR